MVGTADPLPAAGTSVNVAVRPEKIHLSRHAPLHEDDHEGSGEAFNRANLGDWGDGPMADVLAGVDQAIADGLIDGAAAVAGRLHLTLKGRLLADALVRDLLG